MIIYTDGNEYTQLIERSSLIDWLYLDISSIPNKPLPHFENRRTDRSKLNPIFENFRWVNEVILNSFDFNCSIERLEDIRDLKLHIDKIYIQSKNSEELEALTNPEFYKERVNYIDITIEELILIRKKFFENIDHIKPKYYF